MQRWLVLAGVLAAGCGKDAPAVDAPASDDARSNDAAIDASPIDASVIDARVVDAAIDASAIDASMIDAPIVDALVIDAAIDAAVIDAPIDAAVDAAVDAPSSSCPAATWCLESTTIGTTKLNGVFARTADDVFAVGDGGTILRRQNGTWTAMTSNTTVNLRGVWAAAANDAWAVGASGTVLRWNGTSWSQVTGLPGSPPTFEAVWGSGASDVWIVGGTSAYRYTGAGWSNYGMSGTVMLDVHGTSSTDVWATGEGTYAKHWNGNAWSNVTTSGLGDYFAIRAISATVVWITSGVPGTRARTWNGSTWTANDVTATLTSLWSTSGTDLWGVSSSTPGKIAHWTGSWTVVTPSIITLPLRAVSGVGTSLWVVGDGGTIAHRHD